MQAKPLVSIITVTFNLLKSNRKKFFRQNLESVHSQTYENIEHIIIDGASTDGTVDLIREYADKGWVKYISEPDTGIYDAMNKGVKMAKGKYVAFLNSDDYYHNNIGIEASVKVLEESAADFSYAPAVIKFEDGKLFSDHPQCNPKISNVFFAMPFSHQTMLTKREVMMKENMFDTKYKSAADYDFVIRLCLKRYGSVLVKTSFVSYQFAGISSMSQESSLDETVDIWRRRYNETNLISNETIEEMRKNMYGGDYYSVVSLDLAEKLEKFYPYFSLKEYNSFSRKIRRAKLKMIRLYHKWRGKIRRLIIK
jgi:glycosyltransferase involved in cell wall biosynthesis